MFVVVEIEQRLGINIQFAVVPDEYPCLLRLSVAVVVYGDAVAGVFTQFVADLNEA